MSVLPDWAEGIGVAPKQTAIPRTNAETMADAMQQHASTNNWYGPRAMSGNLFLGWPLHELAKAAKPFASPSEQLSAIAEMHKRHNFPVPGSLSPGIPIARSAPPEFSNETMLAMRMRWGGTSYPWAPGFSHVAIQRAGDVMHIWVITKDNKSVVLEDDAALYPSDALVTKLNMIKQE